MAKLTTEQNKAIADCIDMFKVVNDGVSTLFCRPKEREYAHTLIKKYSLPSHTDPTKTQLQVLIELLPQYNQSCKKKYEIVLKPSKLLEQIENVKAWKFNKDKQAKYLQEQEAKDEADRLEAERIKKELATVPLSERQQRSQNIRNIILNSKSI